MYKKILVAVDGSHTSELALQEAMQLSKDMQAQLRIVHAVELATLYWGAEYGNSAEVWAAMAESGRKILDKAASAAAATGMKAETKLLKIDTLGQRIPEAVAADADAWPADLIVIGTHGRRGLSHVFLGSVAEGVVRVATKPVLLVRGK